MNSNFKISYPSSEKVYITGSIYPSVRVGMRMVSQLPTISIKDGIKTINEDYEIVSATGTLSMDGCHIHVSLSDVNMQTIGGHLKDNCLVNVTAEIVLAEFDEYEFFREFDESTGYKELVIKERQNNVKD